MDKYSFTRKYLPAARMAGELYGLNPVVILAQSAIETGWGESSLATCYNNFFGLTGYGVANAYWHGGKTDLDKPDGLLFRRYDSPENSFLDFARLIATVYKQAAAVSHYPRAYAREDNRAAYCKMLESIAQSLVPIVYNLNNDSV